MMLDKCPICGEPRLRFSSGVNRFACGTIGPYIKDGEEEYDTGHTCDIHTYSRLFTQMEKERGELRQRLAAAEAELKTEKDRRVHWQGLAYIGMRVIDTVLANRITLGEGTTEESMRVNARMAMDKYVFICNENTQLREAAKGGRDE